MIQIMMKLLSLPVTDLLQLGHDRRLLPECDARRTATAVANGVEQSDSEVNNILGVYTTVLEHCREHAGGGRLRGAVGDE